MKWIILALIVISVPFVLAQESEKGFFSGVMSFFSFKSSASQTSDSQLNSLGSSAQAVEICDLAQIESIVRSVSNADDLQEAKNAGRNMLMILSSCGTYTSQQTSGTYQSETGTAYQSGSSGVYQSGNSYYPSSGNYQSGTCGTGNCSSRISLCRKEIRTSSGFTDCRIVQEGCKEADSGDSSLPVCPREKPTPEFVDCSISRGCISGPSSNY